MPRQGDLFLWPAPLPVPDGRSLPWQETVREVAELARSAWCRVSADMELRGYRVDRSECLFRKPEFLAKTRGIPAETPGLWNGLLQSFSVVSVPVLPSDEFCM